jgi:hypothetical protein
MSNFKFLLPERVIGGADVEPSAWIIIFCCSPFFFMEHDPISEVGR